MSPQVAVQHFLPSSCGRSHDFHSVLKNLNLLPQFQPCSLPSVTASWCLVFLRGTPWTWTHHEVALYVIAPLVQSTSQWHHCSDHGTAIRGLLSSLLVCKNFLLPYSTTQSTSLLPNFTGLFLPPYIRTAVLLPMFVICSSQAYGLKVASLSQLLQESTTEIYAT